MDSEKRLTGRVLIPRGVFWGRLICTIIFGVGSIFGGAAISKYRDIVKTNEELVG